MALRLFYHPFSSYCWKVLIPLYEAAIPFAPVTLEDPAAGAELHALWPLGRFPVLVDGKRVLPEASIIIEYLTLHHPDRAVFLPVDADERLKVRLLDRILDNYVHAPMQAIVADRLRESARRDAAGVERARDTLDKAYAWLDARMAGREWAVGHGFTLADCAAAPALFYADWVHPIDPRLAALAAYRARLLARPSVARVVDEARPFRPIFPGGAPARD